MAKRKKKITLYDPKKNSAEDPLHLCYLLSKQGLATLSHLVKKGEPCRADAYVARHLVEKKLAFRIPNGKKSLYKASFLGECVVEVAIEEGKL